MPVIRRRPPGVTTSGRRALRVQTVCVLCGETHAIGVKPVNNRRRGRRRRISGPRRHRRGSPAVWHPNLRLRFRARLRISRTW